MAQAVVVQAQAVVVQAQAVAQAVVVQAQAVAQAVDYLLLSDQQLNIVNASLYHLKVILPQEPH